MKKKITGSLTAALVMGFAGSAHAILIDDFDGGPQSVTAPGSDTASYANAIGGFRTVGMEKSGSAGSAGSTAAVIAPPGIYSHSADALTSATSTITWNGNGAGLGGVDFIENMINNVFSFDIQTIDQGEFELILTVEDTLGGLSTFNLSGANPGIQEVAFANFSDVDFTTIDSLSLEVKGAVASDLTLDLLSTTGDQPDQPPPPTLNAVPEPTTLALVGFSLFGLGFRQRKS